MANPTSFAAKNVTKADADASQQVSGVNQSIELMSSIAKRPLPADFADTGNDKTPSVAIFQPKCNFGDMANPGRRDLPCVIAVTDGPIMRFSESRGASLRPYLEIDCGLNGSPRLSLVFIYVGLKSLFNPRVFGEVTWGIEDNLNGRWLVEDLAIQSVKEHVNDEDGKANNPAVIEAFLSCDSECLDRLVCVTIDVHDVRSKFCSKDSWDDIERTHWGTLATLFKGDKAYRIRIWFAIPREFPSMDARCLQVFRDLLSQRRPCLSQAVDRYDFCWARVQIRDDNSTRRADTRNYRRLPRKKDPRQPVRPHKRVSRASQRTPPQLSQSRTDTSRPHSSPAMELAKNPITVDEAMADDGDGSEEGEVREQSEAPEREKGESEAEERERGESDGQGEVTLEEESDEEDVESEEEYMKPNPSGRG